jgi:hypothetical protein
VIYVILAAVFYILVSVFAQGTESNARWKILLTALAVTLLMMAGGGYFTTLVGWAVAWLVAALVSVTALMYWIKVTKSQALKITGCYFGFVLILSIVLNLVFRRAA